MIYQFKDGSRCHGDAQKVGEALEEVRLKHEGFLDEKDVVAEASNRSSALHPYFEWNDKRAANEYRLDQARDLIRSIVVSYPESQNESVRYYVSVKPSEDQEARYYPTELAVKNEDMRQNILAAALRDMKSFMKRYEQLQELSKLFNAMKLEIKKHEIKKETVAA